MQAGLSVAARITQRRQSISPTEVPDAADMSSYDDEPEGSDELAELSRRNSASGMSAKLRSKFDGICTNKVADSSMPMPPLPLSLPLAQPPQWPPKQKGARSRSRGGRCTAREQADSGSELLWRRAHEAGGIRLAPQCWKVLGLVLIPAAAALTAGAGVVLRGALAASAAHGLPPGPEFWGGLVVPRGRDKRGQHLAAWGDNQRGAARMDLAQQVLRANPVSLALSLTLALTLTLIVNLTLKPKTKPGPSLPLTLTLTQVLRASSEVFAGALRDSTGRADEAVAKRERTSAYLEQCEASLRARDDELAQSQRELRELRAVLRESHAKLTRVRPGASVLHPRTGYAYRPASCALYAPEAQGSLPPGRRSTARTRPRTLGVPHPGTAWCTTGRRTSCCGSRRS